MQLTVETKKLIDEVESAIKEGQEEYQKATKTYAEKLVKYTNLVQDCINKGNKLPNAPKVPSFYRDSLQNNLDALLAHQETMIKLTNNEYTNIKQGIEQMMYESAMNVSALSMDELGY